MNRYFKFLFPAIPVLAFCLLAACAGPTRLETDYGTSYKLALTQQTLNPEAGKNLSPVKGIDGVAAGEIVNRYEKSFEKAASEEKPKYMFGITSGGGY